MQRLMQFLPSQQARFDANLAKSQERFDSEMQKLSAKTDRTEGLLGLTSIVGQIAAVQLHTDEQLARSEQRLARLEGMFERHLRNDHGIS